MRESGRKRRKKKVRFVRDEAMVFGVENEELQETESIN